MVHAAQSLKFPYPNIIVQFHPSRAVQLNLSECLTNNIVRLLFGILHGAYGSGFIEVALVVYIQLSEGILKAEDFILLKLWIFPASV